MTRTVWLLEHDDRIYDMGDTYVRGVFSTEAAARESLVTRTPSGVRSKAYDAHNEGCCSVMEWGVEDDPQPGVEKDEAPPDPGSWAIPATFVEAMTAAHRAKGLIR